MKEPDLVPPWIVVAFALACGVVVATALLIQGRIWEWRRRRALRRMAQRLGLHYAKRARDLARLAELLRTLGMDPVGARHVLCGVWQGNQVYVFMSLARASSFGNQWRREKHFSCFLIEHQGHLPELLVEPRWPSWNVDLTARSHQIEFESVEFSKAFIVRSRCTKLAYDICHPRMMDYLLTNDDVTVQVVGNCLALYAEYGDYCLLDVEEIPGLLNELVEIRKLIPDFVLLTTYEETE